MRWLVEVSSLGKTDTQKFCVEAESWQRALQAARSQRGEDGPMSGFSIELLEEGYRAVDPLARVRFVVKRAPDDMPLTGRHRAAAKEPKGVAPRPSAQRPRRRRPRAPAAPRCRAGLVGPELRGRDDAESSARAELVVADWRRRRRRVRVRASLRRRVPGAGPASSATADRRRRRNDGVRVLGRRRASRTNRSSAPRRRRSARRSPACPP